MTAVSPCHTCSRVSYRNRFPYVPIAVHPAHDLEEGTMSQIGAPLVGSYDYRLVALSIFIAISASYAALDLAGRISAARGWIRLGWLVGGATALGVGIWGMHFIGMAAMRLPATCHYSLPIVGLAVVVGVLSALVALVLTFD